MRHLSASDPSGRVSMAEAMRNAAVNLGLGRERIVEAEIDVAKDHFKRGLLDVPGLEEHVRECLASRG
jgi:hypothetical protein